MVTMRVGSAILRIRAPAANWATRLVVRKNITSRLVKSPSAGLPNRSRKRSGRVIAPVLRESWPIRLPRMPRTVSGAIMYDAIQRATTQPNE